MIIPNDRPAYRILSISGFYGPDDHLYREGAMIYFDDEPNEEMEPLNDLAREAQRVYFEKLDRLGSEAAAKAGRAFAGRARSLEDAVAIATQDARRVQVVQGDGGVPLTGARPRGRPRIHAIVENAEAPPDGRRGKLSLAQR